MWELPTGYDLTITVDVAIPRDLIPFVSFLFNDLMKKENWKNESDWLDVRQVAMQMKEDLINDT